MKPARHDARVLIVGGGGTGGALAHDLVLRGLRVTLDEERALESAMLLERAPRPCACEVGYPLLVERGAHAQLL